MSDPKKLREILAALEAAAKRRRFRAFDYFVPYPKQRQFFDLGVSKRERMFSAGTQVGKTHAGAFEATCHATGEYPDWWLGKEFHHPTRGWIAGVTSTEVRNTSQKKLCGTPGVDADFGTGMIPKERMVGKPSLARGVTDAYDMVQIEHSDWEVKRGSYVRTPCRDGVSTINFKSYEQGRAKFQGDTIDWGWADEEPEDLDVYNEFLSRLTGEGILFTTFTPLLGRTPLVVSFIGAEHPDRAVVTMDLDEAEHFTPEAKARRLAGYALHERDARKSGIPKLGSGAIFLTPETAIMEPAIQQVPPYWCKLWGIDIGIEHPFAAVLVLWDKDNDVIHIHHTIRQTGTLIMAQAAAMKMIGAQVPVAWPQDATQREKSGGDQIATLYKKEGLLMLPDHSTWPEGGVSTEAGVKEWDEREKTGRLKIASHLSDFLEERRFYHRKDGMIVKIRDDLLSAARMTLMMKRYARPVPLGPGTPHKRRGPDEGIAAGIDFDVFGV